MQLPMFSLVPPPLPLPKKMFEMGNTFIPMEIYIL